MKKLKLKGLVPFLCVAQTGMLLIITLATLTSMNAKRVIRCRVTESDTMICIQN